ncbi:MAG: EamA family transporter [Terriglobales bacterium]
MTDAAHEKKSPSLPVFLLIAVTIGMEAATQVLYKTGINRMHSLSGSPFHSWALAAFGWAALSNWRVVVGIAVSCAGVVAWWGVLSKVDLSFAYPFMSLSYVVLLVVSDAFLREHISLQRWLGTLAIVFGVYLITRKAPSR